MEDQNDLMMTLLQVLNEDSKNFSDKRLRITLGGILFRAFRNINRATNLAESDARTISFNNCLLDRIGFLREQTPALPSAIFDSLRSDFLRRQAIGVDMQTPRLYSDGLITHLGKILEPPLLHYQDLDLPLRGGGNQTSFILIENVAEARGLRRRLQEAMLKCELFNTSREHIGLS